MLHTNERFRPQTVVVNNRESKINHNEVPSTYLGYFIRYVSVSVLKTLTIIEKKN